MARGSVSAWLLLWLLGGAKPGEQVVESTPALDTLALRSALATYAEIARASYEDSLTSAEELARANLALVEQPSEAHIAAAREAWLRARIPYAQTEVFRFYDGPVDKLELWLNTWPIDESYVESLPGEESLGIVQDSAHYPALSRELLTHLNGQAGETAISTGYHVIEFLLWGRDERDDGPGQRSHLDFSTGSGEVRARASEKGAEAAEQIARRRATYLTLASELLVMQLREVRDAWQKNGSQNYRATFLALPVERALYLALKGMAKLSGPELAGERMTVAYETKNQENEHSCFSDSTQADLMHNALGIENVCLGRYASRAGVRTEGSALCAALGQALPELSARLTAEVSESVRATAQIPAPFDRAIQGDDDAPGRVAIARAIAALQRQAKTLDQIQLALKLTERRAPSVRP
jgi:putative iron-regulated protein